MSLINNAHVEISLGFDPKDCRTYSTQEKVIAKIKEVQLGMVGNACARVVPVITEDGKVRYTAYFYALRELGRDMHRIMHAGFTVHN